MKAADHQKEFVDSNLESLVKACAFCDTVITFAIYKDDLMVGLMMLIFNEAYNNYFLWQLMIDQPYQGKGYGKQALQLVIEWLDESTEYKEVDLILNLT